MEIVDLAKVIMPTSDSISRLMMKCDGGREKHRSLKGASERWWCGARVLVPLIFVVDDVSVGEVVV